MKDKIKRIADFYDIDNQSRQLSEECAELIQAVNKYHRFNNSTDINMLIQNIAEEIADVEVMLEQMKHLLDINPEAIEAIKEKKVNRQLERIEREVH